MSLVSHKTWAQVLVASSVLWGCTKPSTTQTAVAGQPTAQHALVGNPEVALETTHGRIVIRLFKDKAPVSAQNMLSYARSGFYDGTIFHRVIPEYVVQGGGFDKELHQRPTRAPIKNEADNGLKNLRGTVAMARTQVADSATSQFFFNVRDNPGLDHTAREFGYCVVGEVVEGMAVVDLIRNLPTRCPSWSGHPCQEEMPFGMRDVPIDPVIVNKVSVDRLGD
jgi:peptidyl-prolyl cis-trans isomerase A (cyclophilin A)